MAIPRNLSILAQGASASGVLSVTYGGTGVTTSTGTGSVVLSNSPSLTSPSVGSGNLTFSGTGQRITGDFSNATIASRLMFQTSTTNGASSVEFIPNGTNTTTNIIASNNSSDPANTSGASLTITNTEARVQSFVRGTGTALPLTFYTNSSERMRIGTSGIITAPYQTAFNAYGGGTQSFGGAQSTVVVQFNSQDSLGVRSTGYNTSTYRFTAPVSGAYLLCGRIVNTTSGSTGPELTFRVNGSSAYYAAINYANNSYVTTSGQVVVYLNASDYVEACITNNNSTSFTLDLTRSNFCGFLIG